MKRGLKVWGRYNCENCHTLLGEGAYYAPDLTQIVAQRGEVYLARFLADPSAFYSEERDRRLMPTLGLSDAERSDVIAFLGWVGRIDNNGWPPRPILVSGTSLRAMPGVGGTPAGADPVARGQAVFDGSGACSTCHALAEGGTRVGPSLAGVARRAGARIGEPGYRGAAHSAAEYLRESIVAPSAYLVPGPNYATQGTSLMPGSFAAVLTPAQVDDLVAYLQTLQ